MGKIFPEMLAQSDRLCTKLRRMTQPSKLRGFNFRRLPNKKNSYGSHAAVSSLQRASAGVPWAYNIPRALLIAVPTMWLHHNGFLDDGAAAPGGPFDGERSFQPATEQAIAAKFASTSRFTSNTRTMSAAVLQGDFGPSYKTLGQSREPADRRRPAIS